MRRFYSTIITFLSLILALTPTIVGAQSVGVVMSGGGAKGLYHIGVLRALEENNIPIDYITGTSMGSIIGGLYAAGYTIEELEQIALSGDLERWVSGKISDDYGYYHLERDRISSMINIPVNLRPAGENDIRRRINLPGSIINTAEIDITLNKLFAHATQRSQANFDNLMIPFRCMATDIGRHTAVELRSGDLGRAIRASMALPVAFPPVVIDSALMCDGGCYDNFPWKSLDNAFHPDVIIGSCCVSVEPKTSDNASVVDQVMSLITMPSDFDMPEGRSVFIQRSVNASTLDFGKAREIIAVGYNDALAAMPQIRELVARRETGEERDAKRTAFRGGDDELRVGKISVEGLDQRQSDMVLRHMSLTGRKRGDSNPMTLDEVGDNYLSLLANNAVNSEFPEVVYNTETELYDVNLPLSVKPGFDISVGGNISSTAFNQAYIGLRYGWWGRAIQSFNLDILLGPVYTMARVKGRTTFTSRTPFYLDYSYNFNVTTTLKGNFGNITKVDNAEPMRMLENFLSFSAGMAPTRRSVIDVTLNGGKDLYSYKMDEYQRMQYTDFSYLSGGVSLEYNSLNKPLFPTSGTLFGISAIYVYGRDERDSREGLIYPEGGDYFDRIRQWWGAKLKWEHYADIVDSGAFSFGYALEGVYSNHPSFDSETATIMTSPQYAPLLHSRMIYMPEFRANRYIGVGVMPTVRIIDNLYVRLSAHMMLRDRFNGENLHFMSDLSFIYHTPIGPISLAFTKYNFSSSKNMYLTFNFGYAIFGRKGLFY